MISKAYRFKRCCISFIYGARAAFGVVLITTKSAARGKTSISYLTNVSVKSPTDVPDNITDSYPWAQGFNDAWSRWNDNGNNPTAINKTLPFSQAYLAEIKRRWEDPSLPRIEVNPSTGEYQYHYSTDWYKELYKKQFTAQDHNLTLSGGNDRTAFYLSGRYNGRMDFSGTIQISTVCITCAPKKCALPTGFRLKIIQSIPA